MIQFTIFLLLLTLFRSVAGDTFPSTTVTGNVPVPTSSSDSPFDGPKIGAVNSTAFDWWYFDAVSHQGDSQITIVFYRAAGLFDDPVPSVNYIEVTITFPNGTSFDTFFFGTTSEVTTNGEGASGNWDGTGASFEGKADLSKYTIQIQNDVVMGHLTIESIAPAHYPDGSGAGASDTSTTVSPGLQWDNAIPAGKANCHFTVYGEVFEFYDGVGYHDKNWGGLSITETITSWYWGHATLGPFSLVWFDLISSVTGTRYSSTYLVKHGKVLLAGQATPYSASSDFGIVVPYGNGTTYPPANSQQPAGFLINFIGNDGRIWSFLTQNVAVALDTSEGGLDGYTRWCGIVTGGEVGGEVASGSGVWEWLRLYP